MPWQKVEGPHPDGGLGGFQVQVVANFRETHLELTGAPPVTLHRDDEGPVTFLPDKVRLVLVVTETGWGLEAVQMRGVGKGRDKPGGGQFFAVGVEAAWVYDDDEKPDWDDMPEWLTQLVAEFRQ